MQSIQYFAPKYLGSIYPTLKKYFLHVQSIQCFAPNYLGFHISNFKKILFARAKYSILCTYIPGGPYIQLRKIHLACAKYSILCTKIPGGPYILFRKNTFCSCKVFNTLHLNTLGSIYPNSKKYFFHMQSIQYFAPKYVGVHISNFKKILLECAKY